MITTQLISSRRSSHFCPPQLQCMRITRNHSGLGAFLFKFHLLQLRRLSNKVISFHAHRLIDLDFTNATRWSVFPRCTFRKEMVIYTHRSMSLSACWNSFIIINLFNTETLYDTPTRKSSFSCDGDANTWGVALSYLVRLSFHPWSETLAIMAKSFVPYRSNIWKDSKQAK